MTWSEFFKNPVVCNEPKIYRQILNKISEHPNNYIQVSSTQKQYNTESSKQAEEPLSQPVASGSPKDKPGLEDMLEDQNNLVHSDIIIDEQPKSA